MIYTAGDCLFGCDAERDRGLLFVVPGEGGAVVIWCLTCGLLYLDPAEARAGRNCTSQSEHGLSPEQLRPATMAEIVEAGFASAIASEEHADAYTWLWPTK